MFQVSVPLGQTLAIPPIKELREWISLFKKNVFSRDELDGDVYWKNTVIGAQLRPLIILEDDKGVKLTLEQQKQKFSEIFNLLENFFYFPDLLTYKVNNLTSAIIFYLLLDTYIRLVEYKDNPLGFSLDEDEVEQPVRQAKGYQLFASTPEAMPTALRVQQITADFNSLIPKYQSFFAAKMSQISTRGSPPIAGINLWKQLLDYCIKFSAFLSNPPREAAEYYIMLHELSLNIKYLTQHLVADIPRKHFGLSNPPVELLNTIERVVVNCVQIAQERISVANFSKEFIASLHRRKAVVLDNMIEKFFNAWTLNIDFTRAVMDRPVKKELAIAKAAPAAGAEADVGVEQVQPYYCVKCEFRLADTVYAPCGHNSLCWLCVYKEHYVMVSSHLDRYKCVTCKHEIKKIYRC